MRKIRSNSHFPRNRKKPLSARLSAKKTALSQDAANATTVIASAFAPNALSASESAARPSTNPNSAAAPGRSLTAPKISAITRKSIPARHARRGRTVKCSTTRMAQTIAVRTVMLQFIA
jgi:hypothetical protein